MATHRTKPKFIKEVTAVQLKAYVAQAVPERQAGDYLVTESTGEQYFMPKEEFEAEYDVIPPPSIPRNQVLPWNDLTWTKVNIG